MNETQRLLAEYVNRRSEMAFRELVNRYLNLVYSAALRLVNGDAHLAQDVAQTVFADLARKASSLSKETMLGGWLHRHTCFVAANLVRRERRRQSRERQVAEMNSQTDHSAANLAAVAPMLDDAIDKLEAEDRRAILLRFFEQADFRTVGVALGSNEDAARMRVNRALEKLPSLLKHRGVTLSAATLGTILASNVVTAAPMGLAATIASTALTGAVAGGTTLTIVKLMSMTKIAAVSVIAVAAVATPLVFQHQSIVKLREDNQSLHAQADQLSALLSENERLSNQVAQASGISTDDKNELLKLRGEVTRLRQQQAEVAKLRSVNQQLSQQLATARNQIQTKAQMSPEDEQRYVCINNLRQIDGAMQQYALENNLTATNIVTAENIKPYLGQRGVGQIPVCPAGGIYTFGSLTNAPTCSIPGHSIQ